MMSTQPDNKRLMQQALLELRTLKAKLSAAERANREPIAVIGMGCRLPQADSPAAFWQLLHDGVDAVREIPADRWEVDAHYDPDPAASVKMYTRWGGYLDEVYRFDPEFFGISPREALTMDPQQRLLLEVSWEALEHAGLAPERLNQTETGVYIGCMNHDHLQWFNGEHEEFKTDPYLLTGNSFSFIAGRLSYLLGLQGPSMVVATECSSSLVTVHLACQALRLRECDLALAGGVNLILHPVANVMLSKLRALASDGRCKTFDASGDGYGRGEGCGMVVLKRLSDAVAAGDPILAVIRGSAVNHDGPSAGLTVPNGAAQEKLLRKALIASEVTPDQIDYIEVHGTGTTLGDPIEINALVKVFGAKRAPSLLVGSVKTNIGHLEAAAGIAGLIKVLLAFQHEALPPHLHLQQPNPHIAWDQIPVQVTTALTPWPKGDKPRLAGVSSFGLSGINAHLIVEEAPSDFRLPIADLRLGGSTDANNLKSKIQNPKSLHLLTLSAKSEAALQALKARYIEHFAANSQLELADVCFTANTGRDHFAHRLAVVAASLAEASAALQSTPGNVIVADPKVAFLFTGQGAQYRNMGRELYATQPIFRQAIDHCNEILQPDLGRSLLSILYPKPTDDADLIHQTVYTQPALFALEYALAALWGAWGIKPALVMGHSVGEYVAACVAGVFSLEDGLKLIAARGRFMGALPQTGSMVAIMAPVTAVADALAPVAATVSIAAINGPHHVVISGETAAVQQIGQHFATQGIKITPLTVSHAFHSPLMEPMLAQFAQVANTITYAPPQIGLVSNLTGTLVREEVTTPEYWCHHVRQPTLFASGMETLAQWGVTAFIEIGPKPILLGMGRQCLEHGKQSPIAWLPSLRPAQEWRQLLRTLGALHVHGLTVDWDTFYGDDRRRRVVLPTYPFQRKRYVGFSGQPHHDYAQKTEQTPITTLLHHGDVTQLTRLLHETGEFSAEQQALLPALLTALIRQHQTQLAAQTQNGQHDELIRTALQAEGSNGGQ
ncbi:MAG: type I polyketide synthase [Caldilineaceae bacterium]